MARVHFFLQGKGGSGKSTTASYLAQYFLDKNNEEQKVIVIDTDPVNQTLSGFKRFNTITLNVLKNSNMNPIKFDEIISIVINSDKNTDIIVDNGASSFIPFVSYIIDNGIPELLEDMGHTLKIHTVVVGQDAFVDTMQGFKGLTQSFKNNTIYVIQYDFTLGENITIPDNCVLEFDGGSISASGSNDTITGQNTSIEASLVKVFNTDVTISTIFSKK